MLRQILVCFSEWQHQYCNPLQSGEQNSNMADESLPGRARASSGEGFTLA